MDTIFEIDRSVHHIKKGLLETKPLAEKLEASIASHLRSHCDLPEGYSIVLHNTEPNLFTFGGWFPPASLSQKTSALLRYQMGSVYYPGDNYVSELDLGSRRLGLFNEPLNQFLDRAHQVALEKLDDVRYLRQYTLETRVSVICRRIGFLLKENGIPVTSIDAIQSPRYLSVAPTVPLVFTPAEELKVVSGILQGWSCVPGKILSSPRDWASLVASRETSKHSPYFQAKNEIESDVAAEVLFFDNIPVLVLPHEARRIFFKKTEPNVYRTPNLLNFRPNELLHQELSEILTGDFSVM
jgi:hypothetical protein